MLWMEKYESLPTTSQSVRIDGMAGRTECPAGLTTFLTMAYIIFVNPHPV
jgi:hypothetical protein